MKYVIWGCGERGRTLAMLLGEEHLSAFIDRNEDLHHTSFMNIPIVGFEEYLPERKEELVIIAAKGYEQMIGLQLDQAGIPWIAVDTPECIAVLCQISLVMDKIISQDDAAGVFVLYGWNVHGVYVYEWLKSHNRSCLIVLPKGTSFKVSTLGDEQLPIVNADTLKDQRIERVLFVEPDECREWDEKICSKTTNLYEIYKDFALFYNPELKKYHNIHRGQRCFIVATGPSLRTEDLDTLREHHEICLSMNGIFYAFNSTDWRPDYYFLTDLSGMEIWEDEIVEMDVKEKLIGDTGWCFSRDVPSNIHRFHLYNDSENRPKDEYPLFSDDFSKCTYITGSVVYDGALQMAAYMGFSEIYLLGTDCTVDSDSGKNHFIEAYDEVSPDYYLNLAEVLKGYEVARKYCEQHGIKLYNATRGGALEILERVDFDELFND